MEYDYEVLENGEGTAFHGYVSASYDSYGHPIYNSIRKEAGSAFKGATFSIRYGSGSDDSANFCAVFSFDQLLAALPRKG